MYLGFLQMKKKINQKIVPDTKIACNNRVNDVRPILYQICATVENRRQTNSNEDETEKKSI